MVSKTMRCLEILMAEDDPEDQMLVEDAFRESHLANQLTVVKDGVELVEYLRRTQEPGGPRRPDLLLLDLNMPRKDGRESLREIKADPDLRRLPVIVLTTSASEEDILKSYDLGVNSYIRKPVTFDKMVQVVKAFGTYWFEIVELPPNEL